MNHAETIENDKGDIKLVRLSYIDHKSEAYIEFNKTMQHDYLDQYYHNYSDQYLIWDNADFIFGKFYKFLKRWKNRKLKEKDEEKFKDIWAILTDDVVRELIEMLEFALEKEWYEFKE